MEVSIRLRGNTKNYDGTLEHVTRHIIARSPLLAYLQEAPRSSTIAAYLTTDDLHELVGWIGLLDGVQNNIFFDGV